MRIFFRDDNGTMVAMECTSISAVRDGERYAVVATESGKDTGTIIRANQPKVVAEEMVYKLWLYGTTGEIDP